MYDGSLYGNWEAIITMQILIVICDADGVIDMTPAAIAGKTSIPIDIIEKGLKVLSEPDPYSRTEGSDGVRIELIDAHRPWGWVLVNHEKYKSINNAETVREQTRERVRRHRDKKNGVTHCNGSNAEKRHTDTDTDKLKEGRFAPPTIEEVQKYLDKEGITQFTAERFCDYYESTDWYRGKTKISNWKRCVGTWLKSEPDPYGAGGI
jgi:hypothetical protein